MRWYRAYVGMMRDPKLVGVAARSHQTIERVAFVWGCILEDAAEREARGVFHLDVDSLGYLLRCDSDEIDRILSEMTGVGMIGDGKVTRWSVRQYASDSSTERVRKHRQESLRGQFDEKTSVELRTAARTEPSARRHGKRATAPDPSATIETTRPAATSRNSDETLHESDVTAPEADTDTEASKLAAGILQKCLEAIGHTTASMPAAMANTAPIEAWLADGLDLDREVLPVLKAKGATRAGMRAGSWQWFDKPVRERRKAPSETPSMHRPTVYVLQDDQRWQPLAARWERERGTEPIPGRRGGWGFPAEWVTNLGREAA